jgi:hypothetical protein
MPDVTSGNARCCGDESLKVGASMHLPIEQNDRPLGQVDELKRISQRILTLIFTRL